MRRAAALAMLVVVAAVAAGSALAKGPDIAQVCGRTCFTLHGEAAAATLSYYGDGPYELLDAPKPAPYYSITLSYSKQYARAQAVFGDLRIFYVPSKHMVRIWQSRTVYGPQTVSAYWRSLPRSAEGAILKIVSRVAPHAAPRRWPPSLHG